MSSFFSQPFVLALLSGLAIVLIAFIGFGSLAVARRRLARWLSVIVAFAAGSLLGATFFHLLPESIEEGGPTFPLALAGLLLFFLIDSVLWVYHCHGGRCLHNIAHPADAHAHAHATEHRRPKPIGPLNLVGDAIHNLTDGVVIASAFLVDPALGFAAAFATAMHEIPQEVGDFGILVHSGFKPSRALVWNGLVALLVLVGIVVTFLAADVVTGLTQYTIPFAAGVFLYMACTNLLAEIKEEASVRVRLMQVVFLFLGVGLLWATTLVETH